MKWIDSDDLSGFAKRTEVGWTVGPQKLSEPTGGGFAMAAFGGAERVQRLAGMLERGMGQGSPRASAKTPEPICD